MIRKKNKTQVCEHRVRRNERLFFSGWVCRKTNSLPLKGQVESIFKIGHVGQKVIWRDSCLWVLNWGHEENLVLDYEGPWSPFGNFLSIIWVGNCGIVWKRMTWENVCLKVLVFFLPCNGPLARKSRPLLEFFKNLCSLMFVAYCFLQYHPVQDIWSAKKCRESLFLGS